MAKTLDKPSLYDADYVAWLEVQVAHLRAGRLSALDVENVAEELESLMKKERRQLENRLEVLILHLLEWDHQPSQRSNRWRSTVAEQRRRRDRLLQDRPEARTRTYVPQGLSRCGTRSGNRDPARRDRVPAAITLLGRADLRA
jgi:hypothetical protein